MKTPLSALLLGLALSTRAAETPPPCCAPAGTAAELPSDSLAHLEGKWTDANGVAFTPAGLAGEPRLVSMFFSKCTYACPKLIGDALATQKAIAARTGRTVPVWLFSMDDRRDTPAVLRAFAADRKLDATSWRLFHGGEDEVAELAAALGVNYRRDPGTGDFGHTSRLVLLDAQGRPVASGEGSGIDPRPLAEAAAKLPAPAPSPAPVPETKAPAGEGPPALSLGGTLRARVEHWENHTFDPAADDTFLLYRAFLHADLRINPAARVHVQGISAHGDGRDLPGGNRVIDNDDLDLHQAYADLRLALAGGTEITLRPGRQELAFGRQRLVSPLDWANTRRTFDAVRLTVRRGGLQADAFASRLVRVDRHGANEFNDGPDFHGLHATAPAGASATADAYVFLLDRDATAFGGATNSERRVTAGLRLAGKVPGTPVDYDLEAAGQTGDFGDRDIRAWMAAAEAGFTAAALPGKPRLHAGLDLASGDSDPADDRLETFNQLFPLGHAYFGHLDLVGRQNIRDLSAGLTVKPAARLTLRADGHLFDLAEDADALYHAGGAVVRPGNGRDGRVGAEVNLLARYEVNAGLSLLAGGGRFFAGDFIRATGAHADVDFAHAAVELAF